LKRADRERTEFLEESAFPRPFERGGHAIVDDDRAPDLFNRHRVQPAPAVLARSDSALSGS
jgi:hypothetical protein